MKALESLKLANSGHVGNGCAKLRGRSSWCGGDDALEIMVVLVIGALVLMVVVLVIVLASNTYIPNNWYTNKQLLD